MVTEFCHCYFSVEIDRVSIVLKMLLFHLAKPRSKYKQKCVPILLISYIRDFLPRVNIYNQQKYL